MYLTKPAHTGSRDSVEKWEQLKRQVENRTVKTIFTEALHCFIIILRSGPSQISITMYDVFFAATKIPYSWALVHLRLIYTSRS